MTLPSWSRLARIVATMGFLYRLTYLLRLAILAFLYSFVVSLGQLGQWYFLREVHKFGEGALLPHLESDHDEGNAYFGYGIMFLFFSTLGLCVLAYLLRDATDPHEDNDSKDTMRVALIWFCFNSLTLIYDFWVEYRFHMEFPNGFGPHLRPTPWKIYVEISLTVLWFVYRLASLVIVEEFVREIRQNWMDDYHHEQLRHNPLNSAWGMSHSVQSLLRQSERDRDNMFVAAADDDHDQRLETGSIDLEMGHE